MLLLLLRAWLQALQSYIALVHTGLNDASSSLLTITALVDCMGVHKDYTHALHGLCHMAL